MAVHTATATCKAVEMGIAMGTLRLVQQVVDHAYVLGGFGTRVVGWLCQLTAMGGIVNVAIADDHIRLIVEQVDLGHGSPWIERCGQRCWVGVAWRCIYMHGKIGGDSVPQLCLQKSRHSLHERPHCSRRRDVGHGELESFRQILAAS